MVTILVLLFHLKDIFGLQMYTLVTLAHIYILFAMNEAIEVFKKPDIKKKRKEEKKLNIRIHNFVQNVHREKLLGQPKS